MFNMFNTNVSNINNNSPGIEMVMIQRNNHGFWQTIKTMGNNQYHIRTSLQLYKNESPDMTFRAITLSGSIIDFI